jgi:hypothetical protein
MRTNARQPRRTAGAIEPSIENTWLWRRWSGTYVKSTLAVADLFPGLREEDDSLTATPIISMGF